MGKFRTKLKGKSKGQKWQKGQSSISNPKTQKFRDMAKSRFFQENLGNTGLTQEALTKHNNITTYAHQKSPSDNESIITKEFESMSMRSDDNEVIGSTYSGSSFKTFQTFASDWSSCSNVSFSKLLKRFDSNNALHKDMLAILAAVTEVIKEQGGTESTTEYFAALMETLKATDTPEGLSATLTLLSMGIKSVPQAVLRKQFSDAATIFVDIMEKNSSSEAGSSVLRSCIGCLSVLLRAQEYSLWSNSSTMRVYDILLAFSIHTKPKVRKAAQHAITAILIGSCFMLPTEDNQNKVCHIHPASDRTAEFCLAQIKPDCLISGHRTVLHTLALLGDILHGLTSDNIKRTCESILSIMTHSSVYLRVRCMHTLHTLLTAHNSQLKAPLTVRLLRALLASRPPASDRHQALAWSAVMQQGYSYLARCDINMCVTNLPQFVSICVTELWLSDVQEINSAATNALKVILMDCIKPAVEDEETYSRHRQQIETVFKTIASGLDNPFNQAIRHVILTLAVCFEIANTSVGDILEPILTQLNERRESHNFHNEREMEYATGCAVKTLGPEFVMRCIPVRHSDGAINIDRTWLLPVFKEKIQNSNLKFFATEVLELATYCRKKSKEFASEKDMASSHTYELVCNQLWALFPSFCNGPRDIKESFKLIARVLGMVLKDNPEFRLSIMHGLRKLINGAIENNSEEVKQELSRYAKNFLPILLNIYMSPAKGSMAVGQRLAALETIQVYLIITPQQLQEELFTNSIQQLSQSNENHFQRESILDIVRSLVMYQSSERIGHLFDEWVFPLAEKVIEEPKKSKKLKKDSMDEDKEEEKSTMGYKAKVKMCEMEHKKAYRILEQIFKSETENCKKFIQDYHKRIKKMLMSTLSKAADSSKAARLRCMEHLIEWMSQQLTVDSKLIKSSLTEAVLCTKDLNSKCRQSAFNLITTIGRVLKDKPEGMKSFLDMLRSFLGAPLPRVVSATIRAMASVLYNFSEDMTLSCVQDMLEYNCRLMLEGNSREIVAASMSFIKVYTKVLPTAVVSGSLPTIISSISRMSEECKRHSRLEIGYLLSRLMRKYGSETIEGFIPKTDEVMLKRIRNLRKLENRKKRQKEKQRSQSESSDDLDIPKSKTKTLDEILADSDSDMDFLDEGTEGSGARKAGRSGQSRNKAWIQEDDGDNIVDLADVSSARKITATNPEEAKKREQKAISRKKKDGGFKVAPDGRLIITDDLAASDSDDDDQAVRPSGDINSDSDDTDDEKETKSKLLKPGQKRRYDDILSVKSGRSSRSKTSTVTSKYKTGGHGIHRSLKGQSTSAVNGTSSKPGAEYKSRKAKGDIKRTGKPDPYAYIPMSRQTLNKRKRVINAKQFKGIIKNKHKAASVGKKNRK